MIVARIKIPLHQEEYSALLRMAERELRPIDMQARWIIRCELKRHGFLPNYDTEGEQHDHKTQ